MSIPQINNGKKPDEYMTIFNMLPLQAHTPFGNLCLKHSKIVARLDHVNRKLIFVYHDWQRALSGQFDPSHDITAHLLWIEEIAYFLRVTIDELIALAYLIYFKQKNGKYPDRIIIGSIGALLKEDKKKDRQFDELFSDYLGWLSIINNVTNAYKHSFINSDQSLIGRDEPCVPVLELHRNDLNNNTNFYSLSLKEVINDFNKFYEFIMAYIKDNAPPHLDISE